MVVENPYSSQHYLTQYFPIKPAFVDMDRRMNGDYYKKPTQFFFVNCKPEQNMFLESLEYVQTADIKKTVYQLDIGDFKFSKRKDTIKRSMIHPQYARRFIRAYIIDEE